MIQNTVSEKKYTIKATVGGDTPNFHSRVKAKKGYTS